MQSTSSSSPSAVAQSTQHRSQSPQEQHFVSEGEQTTTINNLRTHINGEKKRLNAILKSVRSVEDAQQQVNETVEERSNQLRLLREQNDELTHVLEDVLHYVNVGELSPTSYSPFEEGADENRTHHANDSIDRVQEFISNYVGYKQQWKDSPDSIHSSDSQRGNNRRARAKQYSTSGNQRNSPQKSDVQQEKREHHSEYEPPNSKGYTVLFNATGERKSQEVAETVSSMAIGTDGKTPVTEASVSSTAPSGTPRDEKDSEEVRGTKSTQKTTNDTEQRESKPADVGSGFESSVTDSLSELDLIEQRIADLDETLKGV
eukprot:gb/GECG01006987.1/.p1 GENE.gb/GECG01006987.1/~~gb/GECG01006987.1/.p1  ORF type:complete len:317 (+),score=58.66 gb/GECG01006987.1/:1-951(+)